MEAWIEHLVKARHQQLPFALCTLTGVEGSFARSPGARLLVFEDGSLQGTIGGGLAEARIIAEAKTLLAQGRNAVFETDNPETNAKLSIFIESFLPQSHLVIFGAGHVVRALIYFARKLEFRITVVDERKGIFNNPAFDGVETKSMSFRTFLETFEPTTSHFLVLCSHRHDYDYEIMNHLLNKSWAYLGMIGNRQKIEAAKAFIKDKGQFNEAAFARIDSPIGLKLPGKTPEIIGLSIATKLVMVRNSA